MKKTKLTFLLLAAMLSAGSMLCFATTEQGSIDSSDGDKIKIETDGKPNASETKPRPKSVMVDVVECWVDADEGTIELAFNEPIGVATITVVDLTGATTFQTTVDTALMSYVVLPAPAQSGGYTITIASTSFYGEGFFVI